MIKAKKHIQELFRVGMRDRSRRPALRLDLNENPDGLPDAFIRSVLTDIDSNYLSTYPEYTSVTDKIAGHNGLQADNICLANGSDGAIKYIFEAFVSPGDNILITDPTFAMYPVYCNLFQARLYKIPYHSDFTFPVDKFIESIDHNLRLAIFVNPNNPTGVAIAQADIIRMLQRCAANDVILIIDEAYFYYFAETVIGLVNDYDNLIVLRTFSKLCGLAALRIGYAASSPSIIESLSKVKPTFDVNGLAVLFVEQLLDNEYLIARLISQTNEGKQFLLNKLRQAKIFHRDGSANFVLIKCLRRTEEYVARLAEKDILISGGFQQSLLRDYLRVTVGSVRIMAEFWSEFQKIRLELEQSV